MTKLKIIYTEIHRVKKTYVDEIDLSSTAQWTALIKKVRSRIDDDSIIEDLPDDPSDNLEYWLFLYQLLSAHEYSNEIEDSDNSKNDSHFEREWSIQNQKGDVLIADADLK
jgi:hypothetical protein